MSLLDLICTKPKPMPAPEPTVEEQIAARKRELENSLRRLDADIESVTAEVRSRYVMINGDIMPKADYLSRAKFETEVRALLQRRDLLIADKNRALQEWARYV